MSNKRKHLEIEGDRSSLYNKKSRFNNQLSSDDSRIDPTYGQRGAFPGLDDSHVENELFYGPANDGLEYLRMVRSEAKTVPNLLVAPSSPTIPSGKSDIYADYPQGYYSDGAYTAIPLPHTDSSQRRTNNGQQEGQDAQDAYYASLCARFKNITELLQSPSPRVAPDSTDVYYLDWKGSRLWRGKILFTTPTMILLSQLTQESIICGLEVLESVMTLANLSGKKGKNIGAWAWGLLGKCREVGQMGSEEVGVLRNLGKQAVWLLRRISAGEVIAGNADEPEPNMDEGEEDEEESDLEEESAEDGASLLDAEDTGAGYSPHFDPITAAALGSTSNSEAHPVALTSDAGLAERKQHILDTLGNEEAQTESMEINAGNDGGIEVATVLDADLAKGKQRILDSFSEHDAHLDYAETNANKDDGTPVATRSGTVLARTKQHILESPSHSRAPQIESAETNVINENGVQMTHPGTGVKVDAEGRPMGVQEKKEMIHATLDMLITIIGEFYGQRDLLDGRLLWDEMQ